MSKLAHSNQETMDKIEAERLAREGIYKCERCDGEGAVDTPFSGSDPSCPDCDGEGTVSWDCHKCGEELGPAPGSHAEKRYCPSHGFGDQ